LVEVLVQVLVGELVRVLVLALVRVLVLALDWESVEEMDLVQVPGLG
jgi:hypothetical protein